VYVCVYINVNVNFFWHFSFQKIYMYLQGYYLVDSGYPNEYGFLGPYRGQRYHLQEFKRRGQPQNREEIFNLVHSSLRCVIERIFEVWKNRWRILQNMSSFNYKAQVQIVVASMAIHNYIRRTSMQDMTFMEFNLMWDFVPDDFLTDVDLHSQIQRHYRPS